MAQLYIHDKVATVTRPVRELRGFHRIYLKKGESSGIVFKLTRDDLAFVHPDLKKFWEPGEFEAFAGTSSNATLSTTFILE